MKLKFLLIIPLILSFRLHAQEASRIKNQQPVGVRALAMGETAVAAVNDASAIYWNPAALPSIGRYELQFMHTNLYQTGIQNNYAAFLVPSIPFIGDPERLAFGLDWHYMGFSDEELDFAQNKFSLSLGYRINKSLSLGTNVKFLYFNAMLDGINEGKRDGWGIDVGAYFSPTNNLRLGAMIRDATNTKLGSETLFFRDFRIGATYEFKDFLFLDNPLVAVDISDRLSVGAEAWIKNVLALRAGIHQDLYENGETDLTLSFGLGLNLRLLELDLAHTDTPFLENTDRFSLSMQLDLPPSPVKIANASVGNIFVAQKYHHSQSPWAVVDLDYEGSKPISGKLTVYVKKYDIKVAEQFQIDPGIEETKKVELNVYLPDRLLKLPVSERNKIITEMRLEPRTIIATKPEIETIEFELFGPRNIDWRDGAAPAAAFITSEDRTVAKFAQLAQSVYTSPPDSAKLINRNISLVAYLFNLLGQYGIRYKPDAFTVKKELDTIQYPFELLQTKQGDCDDTTILFAALLENLGIRTALLDIPKHILVMFDTGIHASRDKILCLPKDRYVIYRNHVWLPVETTVYGESFWEACRLGIEQYDKYNRLAELEIVNVHEAWNNNYQPVVIDYEDGVANLPDPEESRRAYLVDQTRYKQAQRDFLQENYVNPLRKNPRDSKRKNEYAVILYDIGQEEKAFQLWSEILGRGSK